MFKPGDVINIKTSDGYLLANQLGTLVIVPEGSTPEAFILWEVQFNNNQGYSFYNNAYFINGITEKNRVELTKDNGLTGTWWAPVETSTIDKYNGKIVMVCLGNLPGSRYLNANGANGILTLVPQYIDDPDATFTFHILR